VFFNFFSQKANRIATEMKLLTDEFLELLLDPPSDSQPSRGKRTSDDEGSTKARTKGDGDGAREAA
jgi:hypothetical protein